MSVKPLLLSSEQLKGVREKLERADECIRDLNTEIGAFLKHPEAGLSEHKAKAAQKFMEHARSLAKNVPPRFGVLAGEIVHHLRSSLDHVAWMLSSERSQRAKGSNAIAFPILIEEPTDEHELRSYNRKIQGIASPDALTLIKHLQPYNATKPLDDPLAIIHEFDRIDKHHNLVIVETSWEVGFRLPLSWIISGSNIDTEIPSLAATRKAELKITHFVAFPQFGERKNQPVVPSLTQLLDVTRDVVGKFAALRT